MQNVSMIFDSVPYCNSAGSHHAQIRGMRHIWYYPFGTFDHAKRRNEIHLREL